MAFFRWLPEFESCGVVAFGDRFCGQNLWRVILISPNIKCNVFVALKRNARNNHCHFNWRFPSINYGMSNPRELRNHHRTSHHITLHYITADKAINITIIIIKQLWFVLIPYWISHSLNLQNNLKKEWRGKKNIEWHKYHFECLCTPFNPLSIPHPHCCNNFNKFFIKILYNKCYKVLR